VGLDQPDDAAVWRVDETRALVLTTDFFTPVVDDPFDYGAIAAANSLSDIYAMGGQPFLALNIAAFPADLPGDLVSEIIRGGAEKCLEAGVVVAGGHTIQDKEPKFGLVVVGFAQPDRLITKSSVRAGDHLLLTKPLGFGVTTTALKSQQADTQDVAEAVMWMKRLNRAASGLAVEFGLRGGTDVTGYGLLGHAWELARGSGVGMLFDTEQVPFLSGAHKYAEAWIFPGGSLDNQAYFSQHVTFDARINEASRMLLFDAQTSGGLLLAVPANLVIDFTRRAAEVDQPVWDIGLATEGNTLEVR
jgi:selenide,water dikinase